MSYNTNAVTILSALGLSPSAHLPADGVPGRVVTFTIRMAPKNGGGLREFTVLVWVNPLGPAAGLFKRSTHRLMAKCSCGRELSAGRLHQHRCPR